MSDIEPTAASPDELRRNARLAYKSGEFEMATKLYEQIIALGPDPDPKAAAGIQIEYGAALGKVERFEDSVGAFRAAVALTPDDLDARIRLARTLSRLEEHEEAAEQYEVINERAPDQPDNMVQLASEWRRLGRSEEARALLRRVLEIDPNHIEAKLVMLAIGRSTAMAPVGMNRVQTTPMQQRYGAGAFDEDDEGMVMEERPKGRTAQRLPFWGLVVIALGLLVMGLGVRAMFP